MNAAGALGNVRVVLVETSHAGNIGGAARAMKTMGLDRLVLVSPREFPHPEAVARSVGATDILEAARVVDSLESALEGCVYVAGLSARRRDLAPTMLSSREAAPVLACEAAAGPVALVFGNERVGLSSAQLSRCHALVHIPAVPGFSSLNLAAAVQVMAYEMRLATTDDRAPSPVAGTPATADDVEHLVLHFERVMLHAGFIDPQAPGRMVQRLRRLLGRARVEREEVAILRGFLRAVGPDGERHARNKGKPGAPDS